MELIIPSHALWSVSFHHYVQIHVFFWGGDQFDCQTHPNKSYESHNIDHNNQCHGGELYRIKKKPCFKLLQVNRRHRELVKKFSPCIDVGSNPLGPIQVYRTGCPLRPSRNMICTSHENHFDGKKTAEMRTIFKLHKNARQAQNLHQKADRFLRYLSVPFWCPPLVLNVSAKMNIPNYSYRMLQAQGLLISYFWLITSLKWQLYVPTMVKASFSSPYDPQVSRVVSLRWGF